MFVWSDMELQPITESHRIAMSMWNENRTENIGQGPRGMCSRSQSQTGGMRDSDRGGTPDGMDTMNEPHEGVFP